MEPRFKKEEKTWQITRNLDTLIFYGKNYDTMEKKLWNYGKNDGTMEKAMVLYRELWNFDLLW